MLEEFEIELGIREDPSLAFVGGKGSKAELGEDFQR